MDNTEELEKRNAAFNLLYGKWRIQNNANTNDPLGIYPGPIKHKKIVYVPIEENTLGSKRLRDATEEEIIAYYDSKFDGEFAYYLRSKGALIDEHTGERGASPDDPQGSPQGITGVNAGHRSDPGP